MRTTLLRAWHYLSWAATVAVLVVWVLFLRPTSLGGDANYVVIRGNSMEPSYRTGDLVIVRSAPSYSIGDAVAYRVPQGEVGEGLIVIHRIVGGDAESGFTLQGDNNDGLDPWLPRAADVVGREYLHLPIVGRVTAMLHQPIMLGGLAAGLTVMWVFARPSASSKQALHDDGGKAEAQSPS